MKEKTKKRWEKGEDKCRLMCAGGNKENRKRCRIISGITMEGNKRIVVFCIGDGTKELSLSSYILVRDMTCHGGWLIESFTAGTFFYF
jgi:hypothetical protein